MPIMYGYNYYNIMYTMLNICVIRVTIIIDALHLKWRYDFFDFPFKKFNNLIIYENFKP